MNDEFRRQDTSFVEASCFTIAPTVGRSRRASQSKTIDAVAVENADGAIADADAGGVCGRNVMHPLETQAVGYASA
jgi:hypothetical protein